MTPPAPPRAAPPASGSRPRASGRFPRGLALAGMAAAAGAALAAAHRRAARAAERRHPPKGRFVTVDGVRLHVIRRGTGRPVLYLHGNGATADDLDVSGLTQALAEGFEMVAIDRPGYGYSDRPRDRLWTARAQARLVAAALRRLGIERPIVVGHSWGALAALALALEHPGPVAGLVLVSGYFYAGPRPDVLAVAPLALPGLGDVARYTVLPPLVALLTPRILAGIFAPRPVPQRFRETFPLPLTRRPGQIRASAEDTALMLPSAASLSGRYGRLRLPTILLAGAGDRIVAPAHHAGRLAEALPGAELRILPGMGHMLHHAAPGAVAAAVRDVAARCR